MRAARIGIAGLGGCGSNHLLTLARMGFEKFAVADPDVFDLSNFNRQAGATLRTVGRPKVEVMREIVLDINPAADVQDFPGGIDRKSMDDFADSTDIGINAIDFFRADLYPVFHDTYRSLGKYSIVGASPFAFGASMTVIGPDSPSFAEFVGIGESEEAEAILRRFVARMTPDGFAGEYLAPGVNEIRSPLPDTRISSSAAALQLCTGLTAAEVLFIVTGRRRPTLAPAVLQFDLLLQRFALSSGATG